MLANKHTIYLTKNHKLDYAENKPSNVFMFSENGKALTAKWLKKTIETKDGLFVIMDHNNAILNETEQTLSKRNYYIESINFADMSESVKINPFDLVSNTSEIHFMFLSLLCAMWDNNDPDIPAMSNLIDAFASCIFFMFENQKEKLTLATLKKMVYSVRANCQTPDGPAKLSDAIFAGIKDQDSMPCKYYAQFKKATAEREDEVAEKVAKVFDMLTESDMQMMSETDDSLADSLNFKTAIFINTNNETEEHSAKIMFAMLNCFIQKNTPNKNVLYVVDQLTANYAIINLPHWMKESSEYNVQYIVCCDDLAGFRESIRKEKHFKTIQGAVAASVLVHQLDVDFNTIKYDESKLNDITATVIISDKDVNEQDKLL